MNAPPVPTTNWRMPVGRAFPLRVLGREPLVVVAVPGRARTPHRRRTGRPEGAQWSRGCRRDRSCSAGGARTRACTPPGARRGRREATAPGSTRARTTRARSSSSARRCASCRRRSCSSHARAAPAGRSRSGAVEVVEVRTLRTRSWLPITGRLIDLTRPHVGSYTAFRFAAVGLSYWMSPSGSTAARPAADEQVGGGSLPAASGGSVSSVVAGVGRRACDIARGGDDGVGGAGRRCVRHSRDHRGHQEKPARRPHHGGAAFSARTAPPLVDAPGRAQAEA